MPLLACPLWPLCFIRGFAGWTIAFAVLPIAWIMQSIRPRPND